MKLDIFKNQQELAQAATEQGNLASPEFREMVSFYFVSRYFTALYEARHGKIPIQIWNEYRNALDHFMRSLTQDEESRVFQLQKMEGHLLRSTIDILKIYSHSEIESINNELGNYSAKAWASLNNGEVYPGIKANFNLAVSELEKAKITDLGDEQTFRLLDGYLSAAFRLIEVRNTIQQHVPGLHQFEKSEFSVINKKVSDKKFQIFGSLAAGVGAGAIASIFLDDPFVGLALAVSAIALFHSLSGRSSK